MSEVSTENILAIWKFEKYWDKIPLRAWEREVSIVFSYQGFRRFEGLRNQDMLQLKFQYQW